MRKFIGGKYEGTNLEIMPSKAATQLPDGTPIKEMSDDARRLSRTQSLHADGELDVHEPQVVVILDESDKIAYRYEGPSISQEWKILHRGERPFYRNRGRA